MYGQGKSVKQTNNGKNLKLTRKGQCSFIRSKYGNSTDVNILTFDVKTYQFFCRRRLTFTSETPFVTAHEQDEEK